MIVKWFIRHQVYESLRSSIWQKKLAINILIGLLVLLMLGYLLMLGLLIDVILNEMFPHQDPVLLFNGLLLYFFGIEFVLRFFIQSLPTLNIETYLHLPIRKSYIVHYVVGKSIFTIGNYLSWFIFIPFAFKVIAPAYSTGQALIWLLSLIFFVFANNFLAIWVKRHLVSKPFVVVGFGLALISLIVLNYFKLISVTALSANFFAHFIDQGFWIIVPVILILAFYLFNYFHLKTKLYPEELNIKKKEKRDGLANIRYFKSMGLTGQLLSLEMRLLWRNKRTRSQLVLMPIFIFYGLMFYPQEEYQGASVFLIFVGVFMTGGLMLNYLNYCFGYESSYFDNILANYTDFKQYIRSKYLLAVSMSAISFLLTIPYLYFGLEILLVNFAAFLYNVGVLSFALFYMATFSRKRMDLTRGAAFNYQGMGASHWLSMIPAFLLPIFTFLPFKWAGIPQAGILFIGILGLIGLIFHRSLINVIVKQFLKSKYAMAEGFRQS